MRFLPLFFLLIFSCQNRKLISDGISTHEPVNINKFVLSEDLRSEYSVHFEKQKIKPLKKEWRALYEYAKNGHILTPINGKGHIILSYEFHQYFTREQLRMFLTPYMNEYDNVITFFGEPNWSGTRNEILEIAYFPDVTDDTCVTCSNYAGFGFEFNSETKLRIVPDWIQKKIEESKTK